MKRVLLLLVLLATPVKADSLAQIEYELSMTARLTQFLKKHKVKRPAFYATLIDKRGRNAREKKRLAAKLVVESRGNAKAVSSEGARGPWQVMPAWKRVLRIKGSLHDPIVNIEAAKRVWDIHLKEAGSERRALVAFSGGAAWYPVRILRMMEEI